MAHKNIDLNLTTDDVNLVLEALGNLPFIKVYTLISKIQSQAATQLAAEAAQAESTPGSA